MAPQGHVAQSDLPDFPTWRAGLFQMDSTFLRPPSHFPQTSSCSCSGHVKLAVHNPLCMARPLHLWPVPRMFSCHMSLRNYSSPRALESRNVDFLPCGLCGQQRAQLWEDSTGDSERIQDLKSP